MQPDSASDIARAIFNGVYLSVIGLTGFEVTPDYAAHSSATTYPKILRNLHWAVIALNGPLMLLVLANISLSEILSGANVLSLLASLTVGKGFRILLVIDAICVLGAGILTGRLNPKCLRKALS